MSDRPRLHAVPEQRKPGRKLTPLAQRIERVRDPEQLAVLAEALAVAFDGYERAARDAGKVLGVAVAKFAEMEGKK
jgi:hypothetical protein